MKYESGETIYTASNPQGGVLHEFDCNCSGDGTPVMNFNPVENLVADVADPTVTLTWDAPEGAINFIIMRNGIEIAQTAHTTFTDEASMLINYTYCIIAEYPEGTSAPECINVNLTVVEESASTFSLYPNPTNGILYIVGGDDEFTYEMYNGMGQIVASGKAQGTEQISVESLTKGIYFIRLTNGLQVHTEKVVVK